MKTFILALLNILFVSAYSIDDPGIVVSTESLSNSETLSLLDKNIGVILTHTNNKSDILSLVSQYKEKVFIKGEGFSLTELSNYASLGANIIIGNTFSKFDMQHLVSVGSENIYIMAKGLNQFDLERYISNGAHVIAGQEFFGTISTWIEKYPGKVIVNNSEYSIFEINDHIKYGAGVRITNSNTSVYDIQSFIKNTNKYGNLVFLDYALQYFDIISLLQE